MKHSPGPWRWRDELSGWLVDRDSKYVLVTESPADLVSSREDRQLIALAPQMAEMLRELEPMILAHATMLLVDGLQATKEQEALRKLAVLVKALPGAPGSPCSHANRSWVPGEPVRCSDCRADLPGSPETDCKLVTILKEIP